MALTSTGAVQVPVPHSGSDVLLSTPDHQPLPPEPQGGTDLLPNLPAHPQTPALTSKNRH